MAEAWRMNSSRTGSMASSEPLVEIVDMVNAINALVDCVWRNKWMHCIMNSAGANMSGLVVVLVSYLSLTAFFTMIK